VAGGWVMVVAAAAIVINGAVALMFMRGRKEDLNIRGAFIHILGDTLSSVGVLVGAGVIALTGWTRIDPILSIGISGIIVLSSYSLLREVLEVLLEAAPHGMKTEEVRRVIAAVAGVDSVHDLHVWSITSGMPALSAHVVVREHGHDRDRVRKLIHEELKRAFDIDHATLQVECDDEGDCGCCLERESVE